MMTTRAKKPYVFIAATLLFGACAGGDPKQISADPGEADAGSQLAEGQGQGNDGFGENPDGEGTDPSSVTEGKFIDAQYKFTAKVLGMGACEGDITIGIDPMGASKSGQLLSFDGVADCPLLGKPLDFGQMMGAFSSNEPSKPPQVIGNVVGLTNLGPTEFKPFRPLFPSFLAADEEDLKNLVFRKGALMRNSKSGEAGTGEFTLRVKSFGPYRPPEMRDFEFDKAIRFEVTTEGFDQVEDKVSNFLFDKVEMVIALSPQVSIPYILFEGKAADFMAAKGATGGGGGSGSNPLDGLLGGAGGGGGLGGIVKAFVPLITKMITVKAEFHMVDQVGIRDNGDDYAD